MQAARNAGDLASQAETGGLALFAGCATTRGHRPDSAVTLLLPDADMAALIGEPVSA